MKSQPTNFQPHHLRILTTCSSHPCPCPNPTHQTNKRFDKKTKNLISTHMPIFPRRIQPYTPHPAFPTPTVPPGGAHLDPNPTQPPKTHESTYRHEQKKRPADACPIDGFRFSASDVGRAHRLEMWPAEEKKEMALYASVAHLDSQRYAVSSCVAPRCWQKCLVGLTMIIRIGS